VVEEVVVVVEKEGVLSSAQPTRGISPGGAPSGRLGLFLGVRTALPLERLLPAAFARLAEASEGFGSGGGGAWGSRTPGCGVVAVVGVVGVVVVVVYAFCL